MNDNSLTERQKKEIEYYREHAARHAWILSEPFSYGVINAKSRRWWNAYWRMYTFLLTQKLQDKKVLIVGCGLGYEALRLAKMGADTYAFDISPELLDIARKLARREGLTIDFRQIPAEQLDYDSNFFDCIIARDIFHHVDLINTMSEIMRVSQKGSLFIVNEIYSHSITNPIRYSKFVDNFLYPFMQNFIYQGQDAHITEDERKLTEHDIAYIIKSFDEIVIREYFDFIVARIVPDKYDLLNKIDRIMLAFMRPIAHFLAGRIFLAGHIKK